MELKCYSYFNSKVMMMWDNEEAHMCRGHNDYKYCVTLLPQPEQAFDAYGIIQ